MSVSAPAPFIVSEYVRWSDVDYAGIIFYGAYVRFFEIAETEMFRACGLAYKQMFDRYQIFLPRKAVHAEFFRPARLDDRLRVATYVGHVGTRSLTLNFDVLAFDSPALVAAASQVLVCAGRTSLSSQPLPSELVAALGRHTLPRADARSALGVLA
jgi:YbgC/YbaW family acyl-CoA thioester hydrolase